MYEFVVSATDEVWESVSQHRQTNENNHFLLNLINKQSENSMIKKRTSARMVFEAFPHPPIHDPLMKLQTFFFCFNK